MKTYNRIKNNKKGSSIIIAVIVMVLLVMLGGAVTIVSMSTLMNNVSDSSNNEAFYSAESAAQSAVEHLKYEVVMYYKQMKEATPTEYSLLYNNFSEGIITNAQTNFVEPEFESTNTSTIFTVGTYDSANNVCEFKISSLSLTPDDSRYRVDAAVFVKKLDIRIPGNELTIPANAAIITGGLMDLDYESSIGVIGGDVIVGGITFESFKKNVVPYRIIGGNMFIDPSIGDLIIDTYEYPSYSDPVIDNPDILALTDLYIDNGNVPTSPVKILTAPNVNLTFSTSIDDGIIWGRGNVNIINGGYGADIYVDGDLTISSATIDGNIYCRGNVVVESTVLRGDIYCDGNVTWSSGRSEGDILAGGNIDIQNASSVSNIASKGHVNIKSVGVNTGLIYSTNGVSVGNCAVNAVVYTTGDIVITGSMYLKGAIIGKGDFYFSNEGANMQMNYDPEFVQQILDSVNGSLFGGSSSDTTLNSNVFVMEKITPIGRVN